MTIEDKSRKFVERRYKDPAEYDYQLWKERFESGHPELFMDLTSLHIYHDMIFKHHEPIPKSPYPEGEATLIWIHNPIVKCCFNMIKCVCDRCEHYTPHRYHNTKCKKHECKAGFNDHKCRPEQMIV